MASADSRSGRFEALRRLFRDVIEFKARPDDVKAAASWIASVEPIDVIDAIDAFIVEGVPFEILKGGVSRILNLVRSSLEGYRYEGAAPLLSTLMAENRAMEAAMAEMRPLVRAINADPSGAEPRRALKDALWRMERVEAHFVKKEVVIFPRFEAHYPSYRCVRLMWSIHDDARLNIRRAQDALLREPLPLADLNAELGKLFFNLATNIFREECILFPVIAELFDDAELEACFEEAAEYGYCMLAPEAVEAVLRGAPPSGWAPLAEKPGCADTSVPVALSIGKLAPEALDAALRALPLDLTVIDAENRVAYFSDGPRRVFPRSPSIIGRDVANCHPPESVGRVLALIESFRSGARAHEEFWIERNGRFVWIRYSALRGPKGEYLGVLEQTMDATELRGLAGQKRIAD
jgi:hypothetical protein